jgi:hypothetical protein
MPNLPGLACHMISQRFPYPTFKQVPARCGLLLPNQKGRVTDNPKKVSCKNCLRTLWRKKP